MKTTVSLSDIARELGVSKTLVSMVLNNKADENGISKKTQKKVLKLAKEMNYKPNLMARGLRMGRTDTVGLVVSDIANPFYSKMARHIEDFLAKNNYHLVICSTDEDPDKEQRIVKLMREKQFDGIIISSSAKKSDGFKQLLREDYPFVLIDRKMKNLKANYVGIDNYTATFNAVKQVVDKGQKRIAAFAISPSYVSSVRDRVSGYIDAVEASGLDYGKKYLVDIPFSDVRGSVKSELLKLMKSKEKIDALFAVNNNVAIACLEVFRELKFKIPDDLSFLSFDDTDAFKLTTPTITAIDQPLEEICGNAVEILLAEIRKPKKSKKQVVLTPRLIVRESVK